MHKLCQRWWGRRRMLKCCGIAALICLCVWIFLMITLAAMKCSDKNTLNTIQEMCESFHRGDILGNLCEDLCTKKTVTYIKCLGGRGDGKIVWLVSWNHVSIVLKTKYSSINDYQLIPVNEALESEQNMQHQETALSYVRSQVLATTGIDFLGTDTDLVRMFLEFDNMHASASNVATGDAHATTIRTIWLLSQQHEYLIMKFLQKSIHIPRIYGVCGHIYAMEYVPTTALLDWKLNTDLLAPLSRGTATWYDRARLALSFLDLVKSADRDFVFAIHICDLQPHNFAHTADGRVKAIDTDMFVPDTILKDFLSANCSQHSDCDFFQCHGWCNSRTKVCDKYRSNSNLQSVCQNIFRGSFIYMQRGLLHGASPDMDRYISMCCDLVRGTQHIHNKDQIFDILYRLLQTSITD